MANTDSLIFTKNTANFQQRMHQDPPVPFTPLHALPAQDSLKMQKGEIKLRLEEQRARVLFLFP